MKQLLAASLIALCTACSSTGDVSDKKNASSKTAYKQHPNRTLPLEEQAFVLAIEKLDKKAILKELGEPAVSDDVKIKGTNKVVASIWHYHYINIDESGKYYETTELDFVENKVAQVVFINNDSSEQKDEEGRKYEIPQNKPTE